MRYQIIDGDPTEFEVPEYPSFNDEKAFHQLLVRTGSWIVPKEQKEGICEKWGWDPDEVISEEVNTHQGYHIELAKVIFENGDELSPEDAGNLKPGAIQDAREDFIEGCGGRSAQQGDISTEALQRVVASLVGHSETQTPTTPTD